MQETNYDTRGPLHGGKVGRWTRVGWDELPDRCYWCELDNMQPATKTVTADGIVYGSCDAHYEELTAWLSLQDEA